MTDPIDVPDPEDEEDTPVDLTPAEPDDAAETGHVEPEDE